MPFVERDGVSVYFEVGGAAAGPPLFLLPGAGTDSRFWHPAGYIAEIERDYQFIAIDPRGFGRSSRPVDPGGVATRRARERRTRGC